MLTYQKLEKYRSPSTETSMYKGVPMRYLEAVQSIAAFDGVKIRVRYRGPRKGNGGTQSNCLKEYATSFAVYRRI